MKYAGKVGWVNCSKLEGIEGAMRSVFSSTNVSAYRCKEHTVD